MFAIWSRTSLMMRIHCFERNFSVPSSLLGPVKLPSGMETHFWYILPNEVKSEALMNQYAELLSPCEKENISSMRTDQLKKSALLARTLVRTTIARYQVNSQITPRSLKFKKNNHGKPEVDWQLDDHMCPTPLYFNISHTSSLIACGVTTDSPIGIDVEEKHRTMKNNILSFAKRYFTSHEVERLTDISDPEVQRQEFIKLWTLKEAYVKALGLGFSAAPFRTFTLRIKDIDKRGLLPTTGNANSMASEIEVDSVDDPKNLTSNWQFKLLELAGSHYAAICTEKAHKTGGQGSCPVNLRVWRTIPFIEDECVTGTNAIVEL